VIRISVVLLTYNEEALIQKRIKNIESLVGIDKAEVIVSDGMSTDSTVDMIPDNFRVVTSKASKSNQMNSAAAVAANDILWFVHADMDLPRNSLTRIIEVIEAGADGGGFANIFDQYNDRIKKLGRIMNLRIMDKREQSDTGIFYGDNAIFIKKKLLQEIGGVPNQEIMEDYELSIRLKKYGAQLKKIIDPPIVVSARRHVKDGFIKTRLQWILIRKLYQWGVSPLSLKKMYNDKR